MVDFSADFRLRNAATYAQWYNVEHPVPNRLPTAVYGLPEWYRDQIREASLVANPGCYPTSVLLALGPMLRDGLISTSGLVVDSKSGVSGAGRTPKAHLHFPECNESLAAYGIGQHRHTPEIDQFLSEAAGQALEVVFTPHLVPMHRGILTTAYAMPEQPIATDDVLDCLATAYRDEPFVRVVDQFASHTRRGKHQLLQCDDSHRPRKGDCSECHRQSGEGCSRGRCAEFQFDVWVS